MSGDDSESSPLLPSPMSEVEAGRVTRLVEATTEGTPEFSALLTETDADELVDEVFADEIHAQRS